MMKEKKAVGFYFVALAGILGIVSLVRFMIWAGAHESMDYIIVAALIIGIILDVVLFFKDNAFVIIAGTVCYGIAGIKVITDSVGSFVDAFQGIKMFGDATQVGTVMSLATVMMISVALSVVASFMNRVK